MDFGDLLGNLDGNDISKAIESVTKNQANLDNLSRLPDFLVKFAEGLGKAGEQAHAASFALLGDDGESGMRGTLKSAASALGAIVESLSKGAELIEQAAEAAGRVPMMDSVASRFSSASSEIGGTASSVEALAGSLESVAETLAKVGAALAGLGDHLDDSGTQAKGFAELS